MIGIVCLTILALFYQAQATVTCCMTLDNEILEFYVDGADVTNAIVGNLSVWGEAKSLTFSDPDGTALLAIKGREEQGPAASTGSGFTMACNSTNPGSPWDGFTSSTDNRFWQGVVDSGANADAFPAGWETTTYTGATVDVIGSTSGFAACNGPPYFLPNTAQFKIFPSSSLGDFFAYRGIALLPTDTPTTSPATPQPTLLPTTSPATPQPTLLPTTSPATPQPTLLPTSSPATPQPTLLPTTSPATPQPTLLPTISPATPQPTQMPTSSPATTVPSETPSLRPTGSPIDMK